MVVNTPIVMWRKIFQKYSLLTNCVLYGESLSEVSIQFASGSTDFVLYLPSNDVPVAHNCEVLLQEKRERMLVFKIFPSLIKIMLPYIMEVNQTYCPFKDLGSLSSTLLSCSATLHTCVGIMWTSSCYSVMT